MNSENEDLQGFIPKFKVGNVIQINMLDKPKDENFKRCHGEVGEIKSIFIKTTSSRKSICYRVFVNSICKEVLVWEKNIETSIDSEIEGNNLWIVLYFFKNKSPFTILLLNDNLFQIPYCTVAAKCYFQNVGWNYALYFKFYRFFQTHHANIFVFVASIAIYINLKVQSLTFFVNESIV